MADVTTIGIGVDSSQVEGATEKLEEFAAAGKRAEQATQGLGKATKESAAGARTAAQAADMAAKQQNVWASATIQTAASSKKADAELRALTKSVEAARAAYTKVKGSADGFVETLQEIAGAAGKSVNELNKADFDDIAKAFNMTAVAGRQVAAAAGQATTAVRMMAERYVAQVTGMTGVNVRWGMSFAGAIAKISMLSPALGAIAGAGALAAGGIGLVGAAMFKAEREASAFLRAIVLSGNAAGVTVDQLRDMAAAVAAVGVTQGQAAEVIAQLASSGKFAAGEIKALAEAAVQLERVGGQAAKETAKQFAELEKDPVNAVIRLNEETRFLTAEIFDQVRALSEQGRESEAATVAQKAYADDLKSRSAEIAAGLGTLERAWLGVKTAAARAWDSMLDIGRPDGVEEKIAAAREAIEKQEAEIADAVSREGPSSKRAQALMGVLDVMKLQLSALEATTAAEKRSAEQASEAAVAAGKYADAVMRKGEMVARSATKQERMNREIERFMVMVREANSAAIASGRPVIWDAAAVEQELKAIRNSYAETGRAAKVSASSAAEAYASMTAAIAKTAPTIQEAEASQRGYNDAQLAFLRAAADPAWSTMPEAWRQAVAELTKTASESIEAAEATKKLAAARDAANKSAVEAAKVEERRLVTMENEADKLEEALKRQLEENELIGKTPAQVEAVVRAREDNAIAIAEENVQRAFANNASAEEIELLVRTAQNLRALAAARREGANAAEVAEAWRRTADEMQRINDQIGQSLSDALLEGGKSAAEYIKGLFRTLVLRPVIAPIMGAIGTALYGAANASTGGLGGGSSLLSSASSLLGIPSMLGGSMAAGAGWLTGATSLGGAFSAAGSLMGTGSLAGIGAGIGMAAGAALPIIGGLMLASSLFKKKTVAQGIEGVFDVEGFTGGTYTTTKRLLGRKKTSYGTFEGEADLDAVVSSIYDATREAAEVLGMNAAAIDAYTQSVNISTKGLKPEEIQAKLNEALGGLADGLAQAIGADSSQALLERAQRVLTERANLEMQLLELQGDTAAMRQRELEALDPLNRSLLEQIFALEDQQAAAEEAARVAQERDGLERQLLQLQGDTAAIRQRELEALDPANRALQERIWALEDEAAAAAQAERIAQERAGLERQLLELQGDTEAIRQLELESLDETNRALQKRIWALQDEQAALEKLKSVLHDALYSSLSTLKSSVDAQKDELRAAYEAQMAQLDAAEQAARGRYDATARSIQDQLEALDAAKNSIEASYEAQVAQLNAERAAAVDAYTAARSAMQAVIDETSNVVNKLSRLNGAIESTLRSMRPIGSEAADRRRAQAQIAEALAVARATGVLPDEELLRDALAVVARPSEDLFASFTDYARDFYRTQIDLRDLGAIASTQLADNQALLNTAIAQKDALDTAHEENMERLDALRDAADLANKLALQSLEMQRDLLRDRLDAAKEKLDQELAAIDAQRDSLSEQFEADLSELDKLVELATKQVEALVGLHDVKVPAVADAVLALNTTMQLYAEALGKPAPTPVPTPVPTPSTGSQSSTTRNQWVENNGIETWVDSGGAVAVRPSGAEASDTIIRDTQGETYTLEEVMDLINTASASTVVAQAGERGYSESTVDTLAGWTPGTAAAIASGSGTIAGFTVQQIKDEVQRLLAANDLMSIYEQAVRYGITSYTLDALMGWQRGEALAWAIAQGLPAFASGGMHAGGLRIVGEEGPELEVTGPARILSNEALMQVLAGGGQELLAKELRELRQEVRVLRNEQKAAAEQIAVNTGKTSRLLERWDGDGLPEERVV